MHAQTSNIPARIIQAIDEKNLVTLSGNVHPLARAEFDQGPVADAQPLNRILLLLRRSPDQEAALMKLLEDQQSKSSPDYHAWLTPDQFGKRFGSADADIQSMTQWLTSQGFTGIKVGPGRTVLEFSGTVSSVRNAFHTEVHRYLVGGIEYIANTSDPQIPAAIAPVVAPSSADTKGIKKESRHETDSSAQISLATRPRLFSLSPRSPFGGKMARKE